MASQIINTVPSPVVNNPVDFGWYIQGTTPNVFQSTVGALNIPYGVSTLAANVTTPANKTTAFTVTVASAATFNGGTGSNQAGTPFALAVGNPYPIPVGTLYMMTTPTNWALIGYSFGPTGEAPISGDIFEYCWVIDGDNGGTGLTFDTGTVIYDPRWETSLLPLAITAVTNVTFDAIDSQHYGLPNSKNADIVRYHWDLGNGTTADGPVAETAYWFAGQLSYAGDNIAAPSQIMVTLTATDIDNNQYIVSHPLTFGSLYSEVGAPFDPISIVSNYNQVVLSAYPSYFWPFNEASGTTANDIADSNPGTYQGTVTLGEPGIGDGETAVLLNGSTGYVSTTTEIASPGPVGPFTLEAWFKVASAYASGGGIMQFGSSQTGSSTNSDRKIYMTDTGTLYFGIYPGSFVTINTTTAYNDGNWHYVVAIVAANNNMSLWVDGVEQASNANTGAPYACAGWWRVGYTDGGWPGTYSSDFLAGTVAKAAIYPSALTATQIANHYAAK